MIFSLPRKVSDRNRRIRGVMKASAHHAVYLWRLVMNRYIAELLGRFVLVFASCGSAVLAGVVLTFFLVYTILGRAPVGFAGIAIGLVDKIGFLGISLAFGISLLATIKSHSWLKAQPPTKTAGPILPRD
jgi:hypothetical protein